MNNHGGARKRAGRPKGSSKGLNRRHWMVSVDPEIIDLVCSEAARRKLFKNEFVMRAVRYYAATPVTNESRA